MDRLKKIAAFEWHKVMNPGVGKIHESNRHVD